MILLFLYRDGEKFQLNGNLYPKFNISLKTNLSHKPINGIKGFILPLVFPLWRWNMKVFLLHLYCLCVLLYLITLYSYRFYLQYAIAFLERCYYCRLSIISNFLLLDLVSSLNQSTMYDFLMNATAFVVPGFIYHLLLIW